MAIVTSTYDFEIGQARAYYESTLGWTFGVGSWGTETDDQTEVFAGSYGARNGKNSWARAPLGASFDDATISMQVRAHGVNAWRNNANELLRLESTDATVLCQVKPAGTGATSTFNVWVWNGSALELIGTTPTTVASATWHKYAIVFDSTGAVDVDIYLDDVLELSGTATAGGGYTAEHVVVGGSCDGNALKGIHYDDLSVTYEDGISAGGVLHPLTPAPVRVPLAGIGLAGSELEFGDSDE